MTALEEGRTVTVSRWLTCPDCGDVRFRSRTWTGDMADDEAEQWAPDPRCVGCRRGEACE